MLNMRLKWRIFLKDNDDEFKEDDTKYIGLFSTYLSQDNTKTTVYTTLFFDIVQMNMYVYIRYSSYIDFLETSLMEINHSRLEYYCRLDFNKLLYIKRNVINDKSLHYNIDNSFILRYARLPIKDYPITLIKARISLL